MAITASHKRNQAKKNSIFLIVYRFFICKDSSLTTHRICQCGHRGCGRYMSAHAKPFL